MLSTTQPQCFHGLRIGCRVAVGFIDDRKSTRIVPHGPSNAMPFKHGAHVGDPPHAIFRIRESPVRAELVAGDRHVMLCSPLSRHADVAIDPLGVPTLLPIVHQVQSGRLVSNRIQHFCHRLRTRGIRHFAIELQIWTGPVRALMRKGKRIVIVKIVNDIRIAVGLERQHLCQTGPTMTRGDDGMLRRSGAHRRNQLCLNAKPAIGVLNHRLVDGFQKHHFRIALRQVLGERAPELHKILHLAVILQSQLEFIGRMDIDNYRQTLCQHHVQRRVEIAKVLSPQRPRIVRINQRRRLNRKTHMIETQSS